MVRLKVSVVFLFVRLCFLFQFHYGSVKSYFALPCDLLMASFQFHYGSVKRPVKSVELTPIMYFNSTMVRLKVTDLNKFEIDFGNFNSTMVRLKAK